MRGILALAAVWAFGALVSGSSATTAASPTGCPEPSISNVSWTWGALRFNGGRPIDVRLTVDAHGTTGYMYLYTQAGGLPDSAGEQAFSPGVSHLRLYERYEGGLLKWETVKVTIAYSTSCDLGPLTSFTVSNWRPGQVAKPGLKPPSPASIATVGMPFAGKWAYNVTVHPVNGHYNDATSSHPSVHSTNARTDYLWGDWATDVYAKAGTPVRLHVSSPRESLSLSWKQTSPSCVGYTSKKYPVSGVVIDVKVDGKLVGSIYYTHMTDAIRDGPVESGMILGYVADPRKDGGCNLGPHVHIELKDTRNAPHEHYACWTDHGLPGAFLPEGTPLGVLGSRYDTKRQVCGA